ncbi:MAG: UDP-N-acetylmuramoyl-tripeptide--D-alanyl-D-alanine ligase [Planctomycetota bacterium]
MIELTFRQLLDATGARACTEGFDRPLRGVSTDSRTVESGQLFVGLPGPNFDGSKFATAAVEAGAGALLLVDDGGAPPGGLLAEVQVALHPDPVRALGDLAAWHRSRLTAKVIGITGSCGKTSTKNILTKLLEPLGRTVSSPASFNNAVGVPLTLFQADAETDFIVCEIGTSGPGEIEALCRIARPDVGAVTNVGPSHLAGLGSIEGVAHEKGFLPASIARDGWQVINVDCRFASELRSRTSAQVVTVGVDSEADLQATDVVFHSGGTNFRLDGREVASPLLGTHNVSNLLVSFALVRALGHSIEAVLPAVERLSESRRRMERHQFDDVTVFDDTYNANPSSVAMAVRVLEGLSGYRRRVLVLGDMHELGEFEKELHHQVGMEAARAGLEMVVAVGELAKATAAGALEGGLPGEAVIHLERAEQAVEAVPEWVRPGDVVLVKASRAMRLERVVEALIARYGAPVC